MLGQLSYYDMCLYLMIIDDKNIYIYTSTDFTGHQLKPVRADTNPPKETCWKVLVYTFFSDSFKSMTRKHLPI